MKNTIDIIGLMSGSSLDGVDLAACRFDSSNPSNFELLAVETIPYSSKWLECLRNMPTMSGDKLIRSDREYGHYLGQLSREFITRNKLNPHCIASHGHTVFHQPSQSFTFQAGHGACIAVEAGVIVISDFRSTDVAIGGQGAPLVPVGDEALFGEYDAALNLGGFSNISLRRSNQRIAFDICPVNIVFNHFAQIRGFDFDRDGQMAKSGAIIGPLLEQLNQLDYYKLPYPRSLGREWVQEIFFPVLNMFSQYSVEDILRTTLEHAAIQISLVLSDGVKVLVTGGGALNVFLIERIVALSKAIVVIPDNNIVLFKEAIIFAYLGLLRFNSQPNAICSATGARYDSSGGAIYLPK